MNHKRLDKIGIEINSGGENMEENMEENNARNCESGLLRFQRQSWDAIDENIRLTLSCYSTVLRTTISKNKPLAIYVDSSVNISCTGKEFE
jgi:hypothetical protein